MAGWQPAPRQAGRFVESAGLLVVTTAGAGSPAVLVPWMASKTSWRWTGTSLGATMPRRTLSPRISTTVTVMSLLMTILSFFFLDSTSIAAYPSLSQGAGSCGAGSHAPGRCRGTRSRCAGEDPLPLLEPGEARRAAISPSAVAGSGPELLALLSLHH